jgi:chaperonin GroES
MKITLDRLLLQPNETKQKTESGIDLPDSLQQKTFKVLMTGPGTYNGAGDLIPSPAKKNDNVIVAHNGNCGVELIVDGVKYRLIKSDDILAIL